MDEAPQKTRNAPEHRPVVGIGASAGGLEALSQFVAGLPVGLDCPFIVAQHMSPNHRSMMADILARESPLPVVELEDGQQPQADVIHIIPPGYHLTFQDGRFRLITPPPEVTPRPSIDLFFQSLAEQFDEHAIGIILSGTGSDGTRGLRAIKSAGGTTFVQLPETAKFNGMPQSAIDACVADRILAPEQIGRELEQLVRFAGSLPELADSDQRSPELARLFERVRQRTRIDFSSYKPSTVQRRLQRRIIATASHGLTGYLAYTDAHPEELDALARETLISVTEFFRDRDAFRTLEHHLRDVIGAKEAGNEVRVWVVGCATGEEAYSLAIVLLELIAESDKSLALQLFATDIDNDALAVARRGIYNPAAMAEIPERYLKRYFQSSGNGFEPVKALRDLITFARHDVTTDPPFLRMDLVTCRNVLIYFNNDLQSKVLTMLRFGLRDDGLLFLGRSESVNQKEGLFANLDRRARLFRPRGKGQPHAAARLVRSTLNHPSGRSLPDTDHDALLCRAMADQFGPAILIDDHLAILHVRGAIDRFVHFPTAERSANLGQLIVPELGNELLTTVHRARQHQTTVYSRGRTIASLRNERWRVAVQPLAGTREQERFLVFFDALPSRDGESDAGSVLSPQEADELTITREQLQTLTQEMASSQEEMQALNEELQAANEELQASNEELESSNEELQATNQELISVNEESLNKSAELAAINSDFESVYNTLDFPVLVFDSELRLKRSNSAAIRHYDLSLNSIGRHISRIDLPPPVDEVARPLQTVVDEQRKRHLALDRDGRTWQLYMTPVIGPTGTSQGVVLVAIDNTELVAAQHTIRQSQERLLSIMNHAVSLVTLKDVAGRYEFVNRRVEELFGRDASGFLGRTDHQLFDSQLAHLLRSRDLEVMERLEAVQSLDELSLTDGQRVWLQTVRFPIFDSNGVVRAICSQATDVSQSRHAEEQLRLAAKVFDRSGEAIVITDSRGHIITANAAFTTITGYALGEVIGKNPSLLQSGRHSRDFYAAMWQQLQEHGSWQGEIFNRRKDGEIYPEWLTINSVADESGNVVNYVAIFSDITAIKSSQRRIEFMATHDTLTGIPNRSLLLDRLKHGLSQAKRKHHQLAILFIDLDNFKTINDSLGHEVGDTLLKIATERLQSCVRDSDTLARLGGDEFVILLTDTEPAEIHRIAGRIVDFLSASFEIHEQHLYVSASIGISLFPDDGDDSVTLLKHADTAMYRAKEQGRNQYTFFSNDMKVMALQRLTLETGLRAALDNHHLRMVYQPQYEIGNGRLSGAEALLRWKDPVMGEVSPAQFIPIAEGCGLMVTLGQRVMEMVLRQIADWQASGLTVPRIAINVSAQQLRDSGFIERLGEQIAVLKIDPATLGIELTESALMERIETTGALLTQLETLGFSISIDDFGTGYSSLSYLKRLPIHELKVDRSFVDGIADESDDRAIAIAIIDMAHALGMRVVAEGVENAEQLAVLASEGCETAQGYYFSRPLEADAFADLLKRSQDG